MYTDQFQRAGISDRTIEILNKWCEWRLGSLVKAAWTPSETQKFLFINSYSKTGKRIFKVEILQGIDSIRSTAPKKFTKVEEVNFTFYSLDKTEQLLIISYLDPFSEFESNTTWIDYLKTEGIRRNHQNLLIESILKFQYLLIEKGLLKTMEGETKEFLRGWNAIATFLDVSVPTAMLLCSKNKAPVSLIGGMVTTTRKKLEDWLESQIDANPYWKMKEREKKNL
jgi:hypothetical protein